MAPNHYFAFNAGLMDMYPIRVDRDSLAQTWPVALLLAAFVVLLAVVVLLVWGMTKMAPLAPVERYGTRFVFRNGDHLPSCPAWHLRGNLRSYSLSFSNREREAPSARTPLLVSQGKGLRYMQQRSCASLTAGEIHVNADLEWDSFVMQD